MDLYSAARDLPATLRGQATIVAGSTLADHGITASAARWRAEHRRIQRVHHGLYLLGQHVDLLDRARAALALCPPGAAIGFHTAAMLQGFGVVEDPRIHVVVPAGSLFPWRPGIRVHQSALPWGEPVLHGGIECTPADRTAIDLARVLPRAQALSILDCALFAKACDLDALVAELSRHVALPGTRRARSLLGLADGRAECAQETHLRLLIRDAGLMGFVPQYEVLDDYGEYVRYRLDLGDPKRKVAAEYDGASHFERLSVSRDRKRHNWLDERGWRMRYFTAHDLYNDPAGIIRSLRKAMAAR